MSDRRTVFIGNSLTNNYQRGKKQCCDQTHLRTLYWCYIGPDTSVVLHMYCRGKRNHRLSVQDLNPSQKQRINSTKASVQFSGFVCSVSFGFLKQKLSSPSRIIIIQLSSVRQTPQHIYISFPKSLAQERL